MEHLRSILPIIVLTATIIWKFWRHPHYTTATTINLAAGATIALLVMLFFRKYKVLLYLMCLPLGTLLVSTALYAAHL